MKRKIEAANRAISEAEKRTGINLPARKQLSPEDNHVFDIYPRLTKLEWEPVEGATWYAVELDFVRITIRLTNVLTLSR